MMFVWIELLELGSTTAEVMYTYTITDTFTVYVLFIALFPLFSILFTFIYCGPFQLVGT